MQVRIAQDPQSIGRSYLQVYHPEGICNVTGKPSPWSGRKWFLSPHMTRSEVVQTLWKALTTALEHEAREAFTYRGETIFDPHLDVDGLVAFRQEHALSERQDGSGMEGV